MPPMPGRRSTGCSTLHRDTRAPLSLAVVPAHATPALADRLGAEPGVDLLQHGYAHVNHAAPGEKKVELGPHRPAMIVLGELGTGWLALERLFGGRALSVMVPPWNRIAPGLVPTLPEIGFSGLSTFGPRRRARPVSGLLADQYPRRLDRLEEWGRFRGRGGGAGRPGCRFGACTHRVGRAGRAPQSSSCDGRQGVGFPKVCMWKRHRHCRASVSGRRTSCL